jgi:hypothetical protein
LTYLSQTWLMLFTYISLVLFGCLFCSTGVWGQDLVLTRQALCHLNHTP